MSESNPTNGQTVPYERFQEVVNARNELAAQLRAAQEQTAALVKEKENWEKTLSERDSALNRTRAELLRLQVAASKNIPLELASRLVGETEQELAADADTLAQFLGAVGGTAPAAGMGTARGVPGVPPASGGGAPTALDLGKMSPAEIRRARAEGRIKLVG